MGYDGVRKRDSYDFEGFAGERTARSAMLERDQSLIIITHMILLQQYITTVLAYFLHHTLE